MNISQRVLGYQTAHWVEHLRLHRIAHFRLLDALYPESKLHLAEGVSARLRSKSRDNGKVEGEGEGAVPVYPLAIDTSLNKQALALTRNFVAEDDAGIAAARTIPIGLVNMIEFSSELVAVLAAPQASQVCITDLSLSVLCATGSMKAAFDEGRTVFEVEAADGQLVLSIKSRVGRIGLAWNRAVHVVKYERSTVPVRNLPPNNRSTLAARLSAR